MSTISPSEKRYVPVWQSSPALAPERAAPIQAADKLQKINSSNNERILEHGIPVCDAIRRRFGFKTFPCTNAMMLNAPGKAFAYSHLLLSCRAKSRHLSIFHRAGDSSIRSE
jgi:hypothetical protein